MQDAAEILSNFGLAPAPAAKTHMVVAGIGVLGVAGGSPSAARWPLVTS